MVDAGQVPNPPITHARHIPVLLHESVDALAGLLEHLRQQDAAVDAGDGALRVHETPLAGGLLDAQVADVHEAREHALVRETGDDVGELTGGGALGVVHDAHGGALGVAGPRVGVGPRGVGLAQGVHDAGRHVEGLDPGVRLGEATVRLGELHGSRDLDGGAHAERAVRCHAGEGEVAGLLVEEDVDARERDGLLVARGDERERLQLGGQAEARAEVRVVAVAPRDLVEDATHGLGRLAQDAHLDGGEHLGRERPGRRALTVRDGMRGGEVGRRGVTAGRVTPQLCQDAQVLLRKRTAAKVAHDPPRSPVAGGTVCIAGIVGVASDKNKGRGAGGAPVVDLRWSGPGRPLGRRALRPPSA